MPEYKDFRLPDVGEGLTEADIISWSVAVGDTVVVNQVLVAVETAKAAVELPSPFAGIVYALHAEAGDTVEVGRPIITVDVDPNGAPGPEPAPASGHRADGAAPSAGSPPVGSAPVGSTSAGVVPAASTSAGVVPAALPASGSSTPAREAVLVGYGVGGSRPSRRMHRAGREEPAPSANEVFAVAPRAILAKPPVRKLARDLGVDIETLTPTGPNGTVSREDVETASTGAPITAGARPAGEREYRIPVRGVRKHTATAMVQSAFTAPHVSLFVSADVSQSMDLRQRIIGRPEFAGVRVSPLLLVARAVLWAARRTPTVNSTWDEQAGEIVVKNFVNLGIAAATDRGLVVPNIKDADQMSLLELAGALNRLTEVARSGRTPPSDMSGGTLTITNIGVFGIDAGTPILNPGEAIIVAVGAFRRAPWVVERNGVEVIEPRWIAQLGVSFDHRVLDGQQGAEFLADVAAVLADPALAML